MTMKDIQPYHPNTDLLHRLAEFQRELALDGHYHVSAVLIGEAITEIAKLRGALTFHRGIGAEELIASENEKYRGFVCR